jgi:hypothetical protein
MADDKKTEARAKLAADKAAAKSAVKAAKKSAKAAADAVPAAICRAEKCKQVVRAKGYCRKHYIAWRRGSVGDHHRYKICSKEACRKPRVLGGLCEEHAGKGAPAAEGAAAT